jgi:hypothetical protein
MSAMDDIPTDTDDVDEEPALDPRDRWSIFHFSISNPTGPGQGDVAKLLRSVADSLETLGDIQVGDVTFDSQPTAEEDDLTVTVYYHRHPRRR